MQRRTTILDNTELLSAISDMMDQKLDEKLDKKLDELFDRKFDEAFDRKLVPVTQSLDNLTSKVDGLEERFDGLEERFDGLEKRFDGLEKRFDGLEKRFDGLDNRVKNIEFTLENDVVPRLSHIEQCYIDTYERYQEGVNKIDKMQEDIEVIKLTVTGHSEELNKITGPYLVK
jgi:chromosome segregation ATPase